MAYQIILDALSDLLLYIIAHRRRKKKFYVSLSLCKNVLLRKLSTTFISNRTWTLQRRYKEQRLKNEVLTIVVFRSEKERSMHRYFYKWFHTFSRNSPWNDFISNRNTFCIYRPKLLHPKYYELYLWTNNIILWLIIHLSVLFSRKSIII